MRTAELRPLGIGETLDVAIRIYLTHWRTLLKLVAIVVVPVQALSILVSSSMFDSSLLTPTPPGSDASVPDADSFGTLVAGTLLVFLIGQLGAIFATASCFRAISEAYMGRPSDWRDSIRVVRGRFASIVWVAFLAFLLALLAAFLLILPGIWLWISWSVAIPALLVEGFRGRRALGRSFALVRRHWWRVFGAIVLGGIVASLVAGAFGALLGIVLVTGAVDSEFLLLMIDGTINTIAAVITTPFSAALVVVIYYDLRVRKEGFDLELLAQGVGIEPSPNPGGSPSPSDPV